MSYQMKTREQVVTPEVLEYIQQYGSGLISVTEFVHFMDYFGVIVSGFTDNGTHVIVMSAEDVANVDFVEGIFEERFEVPLYEHLQWMVS